MLLFILVGQVQTRILFKNLLTDYLKIQNCSYPHWTKSLGKVQTLSSILRDIPNSDQNEILWLCWYWIIVVVNMDSLLFDIYNSLNSNLTWGRDKRGQKAIDQDTVFCQLLSIMLDRKGKHQGGKF